MLDNETPEYLTVFQVSKILQVSYDTAARRFERYPGVLDLGSAEKTHKRRRRMLRIPRQVLAEFLREVSVQ